MVAIVNDYLKPFHEKIHQGMSIACDSSKRVYHLIKQRVFEEKKDAYVINGLILEPVDCYNSYRICVEIAIKVVAVIVITLVFSVGVAFVIKTATLVGRGVGILFSMGLAEWIFYLISQSHLQIVEMNSREVSLEEKLVNQYHEMADADLKEEFFVLTGLKFDELYHQELKESLQQETKKESATKGLISMMVRVACLRKRYDDTVKNISNSQARSSKCISLQEEKFLTFSNNQFYMDLCRLKIKQAFILLILKHPVECQYRDVDQMGYFNNINTSMPLKMQNSAIPYFISHQASCSQEMQLNNEKEFCSFKEIYYEDCSTLADKLKGFLCL